jgi:hypothetical protein
VEVVVRDVCLINAVFLINCVRKQLLVPWLVTVGRGGVTEDYHTAWGLLHSTGPELCSAPIIRTGINKQLTHTYAHTHTNTYACSYTHMHRAHIRYTQMYTSTDS